METHTVRGTTTVTVPAEVAVCLACGCDVCDPVLDDATLERAYAAAGYTPPRTLASGDGVTLASP